MKKVLALIMAIALLATLCACGGKKDEGAGGTQPAPENATEGQTGADNGEGEEASGGGVEVDEGLFNVGGCRLLCQKEAGNRFVISCSPSSASDSRLFLALNFNSTSRNHWFIQQKIGGSSRAINQ